VSVTVSVRGGKEARKMLDRLTGRELQNRTRRATRAGSKVLRQELRAEAKSRPDLPSSFAKTLTKNHRNPIGTSTGPASPLFSIFEPGAGQHQIGQGGQLLTNFGGRRAAAGDYRGGIFIARGPVSHPGMDARPLAAPVFDRKHEDAGEKATEVLLEGLDR
jgi:hypothetical protein